MKILILISLCLTITFQAHADRGAKVANPYDSVQSFDVLKRTKTNTTNATFHSSKNVSIHPKEAQARA